LSCCAGSHAEPPKPAGRTVTVRERVVVMVGGRVWEAEVSTPTEEFYGYLYGEITGKPNVLLGHLGEIRVLDQAGSAGCTITPTYTRTAFDTVQGSGVCTWNSDYSPREILIRDGLNVEHEIWYFETPLPAGVTAVRGQPLSITWQAKFGAEAPSATGWLAGASIYPAGLVDQLVNILVNNRGEVLMTARRVVVKGRSGADYDYMFIDAEPALDWRTWRIILPLTPAPADGEVYRVIVYSRTAGGADRELFSLELPAPVAVRRHDSLGFDLRLVW
jgi:hypothetical protein